MCYIVFISRIQRPLRPASVFSMMMMMMISISKLTIEVRWACGAMDNASDYGSEDSRFDSWQARIFMAT